MDNRKPDGVSYLATCKYCGTQTRLSFNRVESDKVFICPECGARLEVVPPPAQRRGEPRKKIKREYGYDFTHRPREDDDTDEFSRGALLGQLIVFVIVIVVSFVLFIVALISTC